MQQFDNAIPYFKHAILDTLDGIDCWVAGGCVRDYFTIGYVKSDIDVFFTSKEQYDIADSKLSSNKVLEDTDNAKMYLIDKKKIHLIKKVFYDSPKTCIDDFDFTVCCAAVNKENVIHHDTFFIDLASKRLVIQNLNYPLSTFKRVQKYVRKGYWICNNSLLQIAKSLAKIDFENKNENVLEYYPDGSVRFNRID